MIPCRYIQISEERTTINNMNTVEKLRKMHLSGMAKAYLDQKEDKNNDLLNFDERIKAIIDAEWQVRRDRKLNLLIKRSNIKFKGATITDETFKNTSFHKGQINGLLALEWIDQRENVVISGPTGCGKTTLACALGISAIQNGHPVFYQKASFLVQELVDAINDLTIKDKVTYYDKFDLMIIDDFGMMDRDPKFARGLFELLDHREAVRSVIVVSQLPFTNWYDTIKDATYADAVLDRLFGNSYKLEMSGDSKRHLR